MTRRTSEMMRYAGAEEQVYSAAGPMRDETCKSMEVNTLKLSLLSAMNGDYLESVLRVVASLLLIWVCLSPALLLTIFFAVSFSFVLASVTTYLLSR